MCYSCHLIPLIHVWFFYTDNLSLADLVFVCSPLCIFSRSCLLFDQATGVQGPICKFYLFLLLSWLAPFILISVSFVINSYFVCYVCCNNRPFVSRALMNFLISRVWASSLVFISVFLLYFLSLPWHLSFRSQYFRCFQVHLLH